MISTESAGWRCLLCTVRIKSSATLVVCPASLVHQWNNEVDRRVKPGTLDVVMYHGPNRVNSATRYIGLLCAIFTLFTHPPPLGGALYCVYVLQMFFLFFFPSATTKCINVRQPFSGTAERIFMKLLPNDSYSIRVAPDLTFSNAAGAGFG